MTVSIIVPVFNAELYIRRCIESIVRQTYSDLEIWLIDDGSTDSSGIICDEYAKKDHRVRVIHSKNRGVSASRNTGIEKSNGDYILFVDSDDYLEISALDYLTDEVKKSDPDIIVFGFQYKFVDENRIFDNIPKDYYCINRDSFFYQHYVELSSGEFLNPPWNKLIKKKVIDFYNLRFNESFSICEDMIFNVQLIEKCQKLVVLNKMLYYYIIKNSGSLVFKFHPNYFEALLLFNKCAMNYYNNIGEDKIIKEYIDTIFLEKTLMFIKKIYFESPYSNKEKYKQLFKICNNDFFLKVIHLHKTESTKRRCLIFLLKHNKYYLLHLIYSIYKKIGK